MGKSEALPTIWEIPDHLWEKIHPVILDMDPPKGTGRKRVHPRQILDGIIFWMRAGCQWNRLPRELGDDSTINRTFQRWVELGMLEGIWAVLVEGWKNWAEWTGNGRLRTAAMGKARFGGIQSVATPRTGARRAASGAFWLTRAGGR